MKVIIKDDVYQKIMYWVNRSKFEVSGLGIVTLDNEKKIFTVEDAILLKQKNSYAHTDIEAEDVAKAMFELRNSPGHLNFWWHSHVDMDVFWSKTDTDTIKDIGKGGWFLSTVFNKREEMRSALYVANGRHTPFGVSPLFIDEIETDITRPEIEIPDTWEKEYSAKVVNTPETPAATRYGEYWWQNDDYYHKRGYQSPPLPPTGPVLLADGYPATRPHNMSKRDWKRIKNIRKGRVVDEKQPISEAQVHGVTSDTPDCTATPEDVPSIADVYGFTSDQWKYLGEIGVTLMEIDDLLNDGFKPIEVLEFYGFKEIGDDYHDELEDDETQEHSIDAEIIEAENDLIH